MSKRASIYPYMDELTKLFSKIHIILKIEYDFLLCYFVLCYAILLKLNNNITYLLI